MKSWRDLEAKHFTPEQIAANKKVALEESHVAKDKDEFTTVLDSLNPMQTEGLEWMIGATAIAKRTFNTASPTPEMIFGVYDRVMDRFVDDDDDDEDDDEGCDE